MDPKREEAVWKRVFAAMEAAACEAQPEAVAPPALDCPPVCRRSGRPAGIPAALLLCLCICLGGRRC